MFKYLTDEEFEDVGRQFLARLGLEYRVCPDMLTMIVKLKGVDANFNYRRVADQLLPNAEAQFFSDDNEITMRESVFGAMQANDPRARFTIAHELSHYARGHKGFLNRSTNQVHKAVSGLVIKHQEAEANRLAPILLAPEHLVSDNITVDELVNQFRLSTSAAIIRKEEIERLRRRRRGEPRPIPESIKEILRQAKREGLNIRTPIDD